METKWLAVAAALLALALPRTQAGSLPAYADFSSCGAAATGAPTLVVGQVACQQYQSAALGAMTAFSYYIPKDCDPSLHRLCPVIYILHGGGGNFTIMLGTAAAPTMLVFALNNQPKADPEAGNDPWDYATTSTWVPASPIDAILIAPQDVTLLGGYGPFSGADGGWVDWNPRYAAGGDQASYATPAPRFESHVLNEIKPYVEKYFPAGIGREWTSLYGESLGGYGVTDMALRHPDLFSGIAAASMVGDPLLVGVPPITTGELAGLSLSLPVNLPYVELPGIVPAILGPLTPALYASPVPLNADFAYVAYAYGDPVADSAAYLGHAPDELTTNAGAVGVEQQPLFVYRSVNDAIPWPGTSLGTAIGGASGEILAIVEGIPLTAIFAVEQVNEVFQIHPGTHTQWQPYYREVLNGLYANLRHWNGSGAPTSPPASFNYRTVDPAFSIWGWQGQLSQTAPGFLNLWNVSCNGLTAQGTGTLTITVPASCHTGLAGQTTFSVDLGGTSPLNDIVSLAGITALYGNTKSLSLQPLATSSTGSGNTDGAGSGGGSFNPYLLAAFAGFAARKRLKRWRSDRHFRRVACAPSRAWRVFVQQCSERASLFLVACLLASCGSSSPVTGTGSGAGGSGPVSGNAIQILSNRADLISGGAALVQVTLPAGAAASAVTVSLNGGDVTSQFSMTASGVYMGLVSGMALGRNTITANYPGGGSSYAVINHANGGPILAGPQLTPWTCQQGAVDAQCNQAPAYSYVYLSSDPLKIGFQTYDPANPATDVANATTDNGITLPFIVRVETGYQDRDQYRIAALYQPGKSWAAVAPQPQFNHKLLITHGYSCGVQYTTGNAPSVTSFQPANLLALTGASSQPLPTEVLADSVQYALGAGFAVMSTALDYSAQNCNVALQAESLIMAKERVVEQYGTLRYAIGTGCSGGSLAEQWIANAYPGIYQGILPTCSFPDAWSVATQFADYHLMLAYFNDPSKWGAGVVWLETQMANVEGSDLILNSIVSDNAQFHVAVPTDPCAGTTDTNRYSAQTNPGGVRCDIQDAAINLFGPRPSDVWTEQEKAIGRGFAAFPVDNVGVQYGLGALQQGQISLAQFIDLNTKIGGLDVDTNPIPQRTPAVESALGNAYRSGLINETSNLDQTAIIDCRGPDPGLFHDSYRAFAIRGRLDREHGTHANQLIWEGPFPIIGDAECNQTSLIAMDRWLSSVEKDTGTATLAQKIVSDKPSDLGDACYDGVGTKLFSGLCGKLIVPVYGTPRTVAGDAITTDTNKCQLKPLNRADNYGLIPFTDAQWAQMQTLFPNGVCDYSKPGVGQQPTIPWQAYQDGTNGVIYGGTPMPPAPANSGGGWAGPAFQVFTLQ